MRPLRHMAATAILIALATPAASITFPWAAKTTAAKACITSAQRGDLVEALGQLEAARDVVFMPCFHVVSCWNCGLRVSECPVCRVAIQQKRRVYS